MDDFLEKASYTKIIISGGDKMTKLEGSRFETYLMDQELEIKANEDQEGKEYKEVCYEEFPEGFFTSL